MKNIIICLLAIYMSGQLTVYAKKPDWPVKQGTGIIGFGLLELEPGKKSHKFRFTYEIPPKYAGQLESVQMLIFPASALEKYNKIPHSSLISHISGKQHLSNKAINLSAEVEVRKPGLYAVAYGPWNGLLSFDNMEGKENYKISAEAVGDAQLKWIDQDAGDFTIVDFENVKGIEDNSFYMSIRIIRDKDNSFNKSFSKYGPLKLHPKALTRVDLIDANW